MRRHFCFVTVQLYNSSIVQNYLALLVAMHQVFEIRYRLKLRIQLRTEYFQN